MTLVEMVSLWWAEVGAAWRLPFSRRPSDCCHKECAPNVLSPVKRPSPSEVASSLSSTVSGYRFSAQSKAELNTVLAQLKTVASRALRMSAVDFVVIQGVRSMGEQREAVASGASQTLVSKHLTGEAIDVAAYVGGGISWDAVHYLKIATAFVYAADDAGVSLRWGGAWHITDIRTCADKTDPGRTMLELYKQLRRSQGRSPFLDLGHFELT